MTRLAGGTVPAAGQLLLTQRRIWWASVPKVRDAIAHAFGARVVDCGTMAEMTPFVPASATAGVRVAFEPG